MIAALRIQDHQGPQQRRGNGASRPRRLSVAKQVSRQQHRPLIKRMTDLHQQIAIRECALSTISTILRDDLVLWPLQCAAIIEHLASLRQQAQQAQDFYRTLNPYEMQRIAPQGTLIKLHWLDEQLTEVLLLLTAALRAFHTDPCTCVELHLLARQAFPKMFMTFEDVTAQLAALITKAQEVRV